MINLEEIEKIQIEINRQIIENDYLFETKKKI